MHPDLINACLASQLLYAFVLAVFVAIYRRYFPEMRLGLIALLLLIAALLVMAWSLSSMYPFASGLVVIELDGRLSKTDDKIPSAPSIQTVRLFMAVLRGSSIIAPNRAT